MFGIRFKTRRGRVFPPMIWRRLLGVRLNFLPTETSDDHIFTCMPNITPKLTMIKYVVNAGCFGYPMSRQASCLSISSFLFQRMSLHFLVWGNGRYCLVEKLHNVTSLFLPSFLVSPLLSSLLKSPGNNKKLCRCRARIRQNDHIYDDHQ